MLRQIQHRQPRNLFLPRSIRHRQRSVRSHAPRYIDDEHDVAWDVADAFIFRLLWWDHRDEEGGFFGDGVDFDGHGVFLRLGVVERGGCRAGCCGMQGEGVVDDLEAFVFGHRGGILLVR